MKFIPSAGTSFFLQPRLGGDGRPLDVVLGQ